MAKVTIQEIIETLKEMTILEVNELVKAVEEEFGVSAAAVADRKSTRLNSSHVT